MFIVYLLYVHVQHICENLQCTFPRKVKAYELTILKVLMQYNLDSYHLVPFLCSRENT